MEHVTLHEDTRPKEARAYAAWLRLLKRDSQVEQLREAWPRLTAESTTETYKDGEIARLRAALDECNKLRVGTAEYAERQHVEIARLRAALERLRSYPECAVDWDWLKRLVDAALDGS